MSNAQARDVMEQVTAEIVRRIEEGAGDWRMPWDVQRGGVTLFAPRNAATGRHYQGGNILALWCSADAHGWTDGLWATYRQWQKLGAQVRKGERSTLGIRWQLVERKDQADVPESEREHRMVPLAFRVFNVAQVDSYETPAVVPAPVASEHERIAHADAWFTAIGARVLEQGNRAFYGQATDAITIPSFGQFRDGAPAFYATLAHQHIHWSGAEHRLDRTFGRRFGDRAYAAEELVAELGAAFTCARLGLESRSREDHAPYLANWLEVLREDARHLWTMATAAGHAVEYLQERAATAQDVAA